MTSTMHQRANWYAVAILLLFGTATASANPAAPEFGGTWDSDANVGSAYTTQSGTATINNGVTVTVLEGTTITGSGSFKILGTANPSTACLVNGGTLDYSGITWGGWVAAQYQEGTISNLAGGKIIVPDASGSSSQGRSDLSLYNYGTIEKRGSGLTEWSSDSFSGETMNYHNIGGAIKVVEGTFSIMGDKTSWSFSGDQTIQVEAATALFDARRMLPLSGSWNGTGDGKIYWPGFSGAATFTLNIDNGDRTDITTGSVQLHGANLENSSGATGQLLVNKGKFWFNPTGRQQSAGPWHIQNEGWMVWETALYQRYSGNSYRIENMAGGILDVKQADDYYHRDWTGYNLTIHSGSKFRGTPGAGGTAAWDGAEIQSYLDIKNGATIESVSGTFEVGSTSRTRFDGVDAELSSGVMGFSATVNDGTVLDIRRINTSTGITTIDAGQTLNMKGNGTFLSSGLDVISNKLTTVNGTLLISDEFVLTPGGGTLTVSSSGTIGGDNATIQGNLVCSGTNRVVISGESVSTLNVNGTVEVTGGELSIIETAEGTADSYLLVANDGTDAVTGGFTGLPEGARTAVGGWPYRVGYRGGDGNDIVLTKVKGTVILVL